MRSNEDINERKQCEMLLFLSLLFFCLPLEGDTSPISCYNDQGAAVDWFYLYKLPKQHGEKYHNGEKYLLLHRGSEGWTEGTETVNDTTGALGRTVGQLYTRRKNAEFAYVLYNDQKPTEDFGDRRWGDMGSGGGHTKGFVLLDKTQGFWLVHSTPRFPPVHQAGRYSYPSSGVINGQNFLCVTYPIERFQTIGEQLQINQPHVYDCHVPKSLASVAPALAALCETKPVVPHVKPPSNRSVTLTSKDGADFISFAKGASFDNDLYHAWVAPTLQSDLLVQFWIRSPGILPSDCSRGWKVLDIKLISPGQTFTFHTSQDHSKWAVSAKAARSGAGGGGGNAGGWVCVGDINRNQAEEKRGGGTVCLQDPVVWKAYRTAALECEACGGGTGGCDTLLELDGRHH